MGPRRRFNVIGSTSLWRDGVSSSAVGWEGSGKKHTNLVQTTIVGKDGNVSVVGAGYGSPGLAQAASKWRLEVGYSLTYPTSWRTGGSER